MSEKIKKNTLEGWCKGALFLHGVWIAVGIYIFFGGPQTVPPANSGWGWLEQLLGAENHARLIHLDDTARALNAVDFVGIGLTVLGVVIAVSAFVSFNIVRGAAMDAASNEAGSMVREWLDDDKNRGKFIQSLIESKALSDMFYDSRMIEGLAEVLEEIISAKTDDMNDKRADSFAASFDEMEDHKP